MRVSIKLTIPIRLHDDPVFIIDSLFEKYYTHIIRFEGTPMRLYYRKTLVCI